jgi:hypothetical protein
MPRYVSVLTIEFDGPEEIEAAGRYMIGLDFALRHDHARVKSVFVHNVSPVPEDPAPEEPSGLLRSERMRAAAPWN